MRLLAAALAVTVTMVAVAGCGSPVHDPESAGCGASPVTFGHEIGLAGHAEAEVHFRCAGAALAGTLFLPRRAGPLPAVVYAHGSGQALRWGDVPWVRQIVGAGIAFFSYDKRGAGASQGTCCPGDQSHFNLLAADADGAVNALRQRPEIDPSWVGFLGTSEAGWSSRSRWCARSTGSPSWRWPMVRR